MAARRRARPVLPSLRLFEHQVLLLQQLQPHTAPLLLQELPPLLDQRRLPPQRPHRRRQLQVPPWADGEAPALISALPAAYSFRPDHALESMASSLMCPYLRTPPPREIRSALLLATLPKVCFSVRLGFRWHRLDVAGLQGSGRGMVSAILEDGDSALHQSLNLLEDWGVLGVL
ncbi:hypothetical protein HPP92_025036 [Vanilla planifolia]|uniref:Uncharacterized protein n=2 Tax=Vanilla planifolia TaxID=51239 RepID=A0A835PIR4_VANPL|nr:hypothetical protein HPP92_025036 [Vanilla planifolia]